MSEVIYNGSTPGTCVGPGPLDPVSLTRRQRLVEATREHWVREHRAHGLLEVGCPLCASEADR